MQKKIKIEKIIKELRFEKNSTIQADYDKGRFIFHGVINRRDVLLKIIPSSDVNGVQNFNKEILVDSIVEKHNKDIKSPLVIKARILAHGRESGFVWIVRRYYKGESLSDYNNKKQDLMVNRYGLIQRKFKKRKRDIVVGIIDNIKSLQTLTTDFRKLGIRRDSFRRRFFSHLEDYNINKIETELEYNLDKCIDFFNSNKSEYYDKKSRNIQACMGDLSPSNIIVRSDNQVIFSDFEWFCFDNYTMDVAFLWLFLWRHRDWQRNIANALITNEDDRNYFRMSVIRIIIGWYDAPFSSKKKSDINKRKLYKKHVWTKYLKAACESYEALMKVNKILEL